VKVIKWKKNQDNINKVSSKRRPRNQGSVNQDAWSPTVAISKLQGTFRKLWANIFARKILTFVVDVLIVSCKKVSVFLIVGSWHIVSDLLEIR